MSGYCYMMDSIGIQPVCSLAVEGVMNGCQGTEA